MNDKPKYNPNIHHRRSIRLKGYDYSQAGLYFITICCQHRACLFGKIVRTNAIRPEMILNEFGQIAYNEWIKTPEIRNNVELGDFVIMPNHIHGIIRLTRRGELHSPNDETHNSPNYETRNSPDYETGNLLRRGELHSPDFTTHNSPDYTTGNSPDFTTHNSPDYTTGNSPDYTTGNSPDYTTGNSPDYETHNSTDYETGNSSRIKGEYNSPLRGPSNNIGAIVRGYKSTVTKQLNLLNIGYPVWQRNYYEHIIRNEKSYQTISDYIINNPAKWNEDKFYKQ